MKYIKITIAVAVLFCWLASCERDEVFEKEQYKNVFALVSESDNTVLKYHDLRRVESAGYVSASLGGTNSAGQDIVIQLTEDKSLIEEFNQLNFDVDRAQYHPALSASKYRIDSDRITIPADSVRGVLPITVMPAGLSPDSVYMIALRIDAYNACEANSAKDYVLYQVRTKNWWAMSGGTAYTMRCNVRDVVADTRIDIPGTKKIYPLAARKVRLLAGSENNDLNKLEPVLYYSLALTIGDDNKVSIAPYKSVAVTQIDGDEDYPNIVKIEDDGFKTYKTFLLHYSYTGSDGKLYEIREELRLEFNSKTEEPRFLEN
ncbi:MAG: DUF4361 domain-containing protein [Bacteroidales bacterium]|jgi:hypothetical protein|nr:DUF4361 domain-containing protein [Bacteroidales bacterium]